MDGEFIGIAGLSFKDAPQGWLEAAAWQVYVMYQDPGRNPVLSIQLKWGKEEKGQSRQVHVWVNLQHL